MNAPWINYLVAFACVAGLALGQILFKMAANALQGGYSVWQPQVLVCLCFAFGLYGVTSLAWVWVLRDLALSRVYPLMALAFVMVPLAARLQFGEVLDSRYFMGMGLIVAGVVLTTMR